jgi:transcriptional antiterminator RfaH
MSKEWYILQHKPNAHHQAVRHLNQQGFKTFLPLHYASLRRVNRFTNVKQPLFPGYMFIAFDKVNCQWGKINNTYGVSRLITFNSNLKSIPTEAINNLIKRCDFSGVLLPEKKFNNGDEVKVMKGPFANFIATVERYETEQRIWILMDLLGRKTKIQSSPDDLQPSN